MKHPVPLRIVALISIFIFMACKQQPKAEAALENEPGTNEEPPQAGIQIIPIEHASAVLIWDGTTIYIDPVGGPEAFVDVPDPDLILITDIHGDHFDLETLKSLNTERSKIVVPQAVAYKMSEEFIPQLEIMENGDHREINDLDIEAVPMYNLREEALDFHLKGRGNGYVLSKNGERIYFSGDTEDIPEMRSLKNIDIAFICMNLPYTMTVESAADAVLDFKPKEVYPYHYRGNPDVSDVALFKKLVTEKDSDIEVIQLDWYPKEPY